MRFDLPNSFANINYIDNQAFDINNNNPDEYEVIIIGAGLSGLYAANILRENGVNNFCVLEARDRVGGRTYTKKGDNVGYVDVGGAYVGPNQLYMQRLIKKFGLKTFKVNTKGSNVYLNRKRRFMHKCDGLPAMGSLVEMEVKYVFGLIEHMCEQIPKEEPWKAARAEEWDHISFGQFLERHCWTKEARQFIELYLGCCTSCEAYECSLLWVLWFTKQCDGLEHMFNIADAAQDSKIVGGTQQISERLCELIDKERVLLNKPVVQITVLQQQHEWPVSVRTLDGTLYHAKHIIMAIPFSVQQKIHYDPPLPPLYHQMIQKMPMGSTIKSIVYYKETFWRDDGLTGSMMINLPLEQGPISYTLDDTKPDGSYPAIVGFIIGDRARVMLAKSKNERLRIICESFAKALGSNKALEPVHYEEKNWMSEQYTGGCFTSFAIPGFLTAYGPLLRQPLFDGKIELAGTETATYWSGYMDGALQAGERAAVRVLHRLQIKPKPESVLCSTNNNRTIVQQSDKMLVKRLSNYSLNQLPLGPSLHQLITWSSLLVAMVGLIIITSF